MEAMTTPLLVSFIAGSQGTWRIDAIHAIAGATLPGADYLTVDEGAAQIDSNPPIEAHWRLRGVISNTRYTRRNELSDLGAIQQGLGRPPATRAALIPIRKSAAWWALAQDERRAIFEEQSRHIGIGMDYLPAVARRLHHSRDLGEPFDFVTWFEFALQDEAAFDAMLARLRETAEWRFIEREVDIRLTRC